MRSIFSKVSLFQTSMFSNFLIISAITSANAWNLTDVDNISNIRNKWVEKMGSAEVERLKNTLSSIDNSLSDSHRLGILYSQLCRGHQCENPATNTPKNDITSLNALTGFSTEKEYRSSKTPTFFSGTAMRCREYIAESINCCQDSGWIKKIARNRCDSQEMTIASSKDHMRAVYVGGHCKKRFLHSCVEVEELYCIFPSNIAKTIQEKGRLNKLHINFGRVDKGTSSINCRGLTESELEMIDLSSLDFSSLESNSPHTDQQLSQHGVIETVERLENRE